MPGTLSECRSTFQRIHTYQRDAHAYFQSNQHPEVQDAPVLKDLIISEKSREPSLTGEYFTTTHELLSHIQANEEFDKPIVGVLKINRTPHHVQIEAVKHSSNSEWTILALDSLPLKSRGFKHLLRPVVASMKNIVEELGDAKAAVGVLSTQKAPSGCAMHSLAGLKLSSQLRPEMMAIHEEINRSGMLSSARPPVEDPYEEISNEIVDEDVPLQIRDAATAVPLPYYGYASSRSTLGNLQSMLPNLPLERTPVTISGKTYDSVFKCFEDNEEKRLLDVSHTEPTTVNTRIEKFRLRVASEATDYYRKEMVAMENSATTGTSSEFETGFRKGFLSGKKDLF